MLKRREKGENAGEPVTDTLPHNLPHPVTRFILRREEGEPKAIARRLRALGDLATARGERERAAGFYVEADGLSGNT
jgi:hypothetical protein